MCERYHRRTWTSGRDGIIVPGCHRARTFPTDDRSRRWPIPNRKDDCEVQFRELSGRLELDYPVLWVYKVIGTDEATLRAAVLEVVSADDEVTLELSNRSSGGAYVSINVEVQVVSEEHRKGLYRSLREHPEVRMVL